MTARAVRGGNLLRARLLAVSALAAATLAACGGGPSGASAPDVPCATSGTASTGTGGAGTTQRPGGGGSVDACTLLTADDIKAVTGYAVSKAVPTAANIVFPSGCEWELVASEIVPPSIVLSIMTSGGRSYYATYFKPYNGEEGRTPIAGLGDEAVDDGFGAVMVVKGDNLFNLQYLGDKDHATELAKKLVAHL